MNGFITESVSKISDGFGSTLKLLVFSVLGGIAAGIVMDWNTTWGIVTLLFLMGVLMAAFLVRSFTRDVRDSQKAWCGMAAGVFLWQALRLLPAVPGLEWVGRIGLAWWAAIALLTFLMWKPLLTVGLRFLLLSFLLNWLGWIYKTSLDLAVNGYGLLGALYANLRYLGIAGILVSVWWIVTRSHSQMERKYGGLALYFFILFTFLFF